jgi:outer membrane receptor protein involved in Fe transport
MLALLALALARPSVLAQQAARHENKTGAGGNDDNDEIIELSPFVVQTQRDDGFVAASSLAGGRLAGDLKDTPAAYSVITKEFIEALNITDVEEANRWAVNMSTSQGDGYSDLISRAVNPIVRGVASGGQQRNFFPSTFKPDSYNLDRYDFARGPNAILYGTGSLGGLVNIVTKQALLRKTIADLGLQVGSWNRRRVTGDFNLPVGRTFAARVNVLHQKLDGWRDNEFDNRKAIDAALTWQPVRGLRIQAEGEWGKIDRNAIITTIADQVSGWDGVTTASAPQKITMAGAAGKGVRRFSYPLSIANLDPAGGLVNYGGFYSTIGGGQAAGVPVGGKPAPYTVNLNIAGSPILNAVNVLSNEERFACIYNSPIVPQATKDFFRNFDSTFSTALDDPNYLYDYRLFSVSANYQARGRFFAEIAGNYVKEDWESMLTARSAMPQVYIDLTETLPDGSGNPGFLQPYGQEAHLVAPLGKETCNVRAAAAYIFDHEKLGTLTASVMAGWQYWRQEQRQYSYGLKGMTGDPRTWTRPFGVDGAGNITFDNTSIDPRIFYRYYWTINTPGNRPRRDLPEGVYTVTDASGNEYSGVPAMLIDMRTPSNQSRQKTSQTYFQGAMNWKMLQGRLICLGAVRHDIYTSRVWTPPADIYDPAYGPGWDGLTVPFRPLGPDNYGDLSEEEQALWSSPAVDAVVTTFSSGAIFHARNWLSPYVNYAQTFSPAGNARDIRGGALGPSQAQGWDFGVRLTLLDRRVSAAINYYFGKEVNSPVGAGTIGGYINTIVNTGVNGEMGVNARGLLPVQVGHYDSRTRRTEGMEVDVTANLTTQWRLSFNIAAPQAFQTGAYKDTRAFIEREEYRMMNILRDTGMVAFVEGKRAYATTTAAPYYLISRSIPQWNSLIGFASGDDDEFDQKITRRVSLIANLFTVYTFNKGWLRGLRIGGGVNYRGKEIVNTGNAYADDWFLATLTLGYAKRLLRKHYITFNLRIDNLFDYDKPRYVNTISRAPDGRLDTSARVATPNAYYYVPPRSLVLATGFKF